MVESSWLLKEDLKTLVEVVVEPLLVLAQVLKSQLKLPLALEPAQTRFFVQVHSLKVKDEAI